MTTCRVTSGSHSRPASMKSRSPKARETARAPAILFLKKQPTSLNLAYSFRLVLHLWSSLSWINEKSDCGSCLFFCTSMALLSPTHATYRTIVLSFGFFRIKHTVPVLPYSFAQKPIKSLFLNYSFTDWNRSFNGWVRSDSGGYLLNKLLICQAIVSFKNCETQWPPCPSNTQNKLDVFFPSAFVTIRWRSSMTRIDSSFISSNEPTS